MRTEIIIAHLSDLHHPSINDDRWTRLTSYLTERKPDVILVTGDLTNHPWPKSQLQVRQKLKELVEACRKAKRASSTAQTTSIENSNASSMVQLWVIPGNHDCAFWGNIGSSVLRLISFDRIFSEYQTPTFEMPLGNGKVYFFCFNSNPFVARWARGKVSQRQLKAFRQKIEELRKRDPEGFESSYKIALLHHHPMPIPYDEKLETYLFLKNASEFINVMVQSGINAILHGHKHKSRVSYVSLGTTSTGRNIGIVACGTTLRKEDQNACNLIRIFDNMRAEVTQVFAEAGEDFVEKQVRFSIPQWNTYIQERYEAIRSKLGYEIECVSRKTIIDQDGDGHTEVKISELRITHHDRFEEVKAFGQNVNSGRISAPKIHASGAVAERINQDTSQPQRNLLKLDLSPDDEVAYSFGFEYWSLNSWALDRGQWDRKYQHNSDMPRHAEEAYFDFTRPIKRFRAEIQLPDNSRVQEEPELIIRAFFSDDKGKMHLSKPIKGIESYLNTSLTFSLERNVMLLAIDKPLCDYRYTIRWYLPAPSRMENSEGYRNEVESLIAQLYALRNVKRLFKSEMMKVDEMIRRRFKDDLGKIIKTEETLDVTLAIPVSERDQDDDQAASLEFISSNLDNHPILGKRLEIGDGTAGRAYRMNRILEYRADRVGDDDPKGNIYVTIANYVHKILYAIPLVHPLNQYQVIGILSIGSRESLSGLIPKENANEAEQKQRAIVMVQIANDYLLPRLEEKCEVKLSR